MDLTVLLELYQFLVFSCYFYKHWFILYTMYSFKPCFKASYTWTKNVPIKFDAKSDLFLVFCLFFVHNMTAKFLQQNAALIKRSQLKVWCIISCIYIEKKCLVRGGFLSTIVYKITQTKINRQKYLFLVMPLWYFSFSRTCSQKQLTSFQCKLLLLAVISFTMLKRPECKKWSFISDLFKERIKQSCICIYRFTLEHKYTTIASTKKWQNYPFLVKPKWLNFLFRHYLK